jgi:hypothetical protein
MPVIGCFVIFLLNSLQALKAWEVAIKIQIWGAVVVVIVWQLDLQLPVQSVPIITKVVSSNPIHGEVYSIHYVIKFVSDLRQVCS